MFSVKLVIFGVKLVIKQALNHHYKGLKLYQLYISFNLKIINNYLLKFEWNKELMSHFQSLAISTA